MIKSLLLLILLSACICSSYAFGCPFSHLHKAGDHNPHKKRSDLGSHTLHKRDALPIGIVPLSLQPQDTKNYTIDAETHQYQAPRPGDQRGACPGLNTLANHGYINRNGVATYQEFVNAQMRLGSFCNDASIVVASLALVRSGNLVTGEISIGDRVANGPFDGSGLNAHNGGIEHDVSQSRTDTNLGNNHILNQTLWNQMVDAAARSSEPWGRDWGSEFRYSRYLDSARNNPQLAYAPLDFIKSCLTDIAGIKTFRLPNQAATYDTYSSIFLEERLFPGFGVQSECLSVPKALDYTFYVYQQHPVPLTSGINQGSTYIPFPSQVSCMMCYFRRVLTNFIDTLALTDALGAAFLRGKLLDSDLITCIVPGCGY